IKIVTQEDIRKLQQIIDMQQLMLKNNDYNGFYNFDEEFHKSIADFSGYPRVWEVIKREKVQLDRVRFLSLPNNSHIEILIEQHHQIVNFLETGEIDSVVDIVRQHTQSVLGSLEKIIKEKKQYFS